MQLEVIQQKIYEIRGQKVMLDFDLAVLYEVETRILNQAVKRNLARFPEDFLFRLTTKEFEDNSSQFVMSSGKHRGKIYLPYAFTEHGVTMLASVLKSDNAIKMNIAIVRAFIGLRRIALHQTNIYEQLKELNQRINEHDVQLSYIYDTIENLLDNIVVEKSKVERPAIGFKNQATG